MRHWSAEPWAALSPLQQCAHVRHRVGIAFQAVRILFGLQFNLQPDAVRIVEVEGLAIPPFDNCGHGNPMVLEQLSKDRKSTRLNSSHMSISYAVFCLKKKKKKQRHKNAIQDRTTHIYRVN